MKTLRGRLTAFVTSAVGLVLAAGEADLYFKAKDLLVTVFDQALKDKVRMLTAYSTDDHQAIGFDFTDQDLVEFRPGPDAEYFQIWLPNGDTHAKSESLGQSQLPFPGQELLTFQNVDLSNGQTVRAILARLGNDDGNSEYRIALAKDRSSLDKSLRRVVIESALTIIAMLAGVVIATSLAVRLGLCHRRNSFP